MRAPPEDQTVALGPMKPVVEPDRRPRGPSIGGPGVRGRGTINGPLETLAREEIQRTRRFCYVSLILSSVTGGLVPWLGGDPAAGTLLLAALGVAMLAAAFMLYRTRDPVQFGRPTTALAWFALAAATTMVVPYFGAFSPAPMMLVLAIFFTGLGKSTRLVCAVYVVFAGVEGLVSFLVIAGVTRDTGLINATHLHTRQQLIAQGLVQFVLAITLFMARVSRRTQLVAIEELEREVRISAHRQALLIEAREQLDRVLRPGRGRFSDQQIGSYLLGTVIGRGAMGEVYEANGPRGVVAIKLLSQASLGNANYVLRFLRELRTAAAIEAPNVVQVLEVGEQPVPYLVMERLEGKTLSDILRSKRALADAEVGELIRQIGAGVTAAGAAGIVHRDLKPQNVFHHRDTWKILDFGIARALDHGDTLTAGHIVGTPSYMAPEQASGGAIEHATDLYALAAIAYRALTGHQVFATGDLAEALYSVVHLSPRRPSDLATHLPHEVDLVLAIGLAKRQSDRFATAGELADALEAALAGQLPSKTRHRGFALVRGGAWAESRRAKLRTRQAHVHEEGATW